MVDSVLLGRDSNRDVDRYRANSIHDSNNSNSNNNVDGFNNLADGSISHIFRFCIVPSGSTYVNDHSSNVICLITCNKCNLQYVGETS